MRVKTVAELLASGWVLTPDRYYRHPNVPSAINMNMITDYVGMNFTIPIHLKEGEGFAVFGGGFWTWYKLMLTDDPPKPKYARNLPDWF